MTATLAPAVELLASPGEEPLPLGPQNGEDWWTLAEATAAASPPPPFPGRVVRRDGACRVRGTCCLYCQICDQLDRDGEGYCATCHMRTDDSRTRRLRSHLEAPN